MVRWRGSLQSFVMCIRHVSGAKNTVADWLSRMHAYLASERVMIILSAEHADVSCLMSCILERHIPAKTSLKSKNGTDYK